MSRPVLKCGGVATICLTFDGLYIRLRSWTSPSGLALAIRRHVALGMTFRLVPEVVVRHHNRQRPALHSHTYRTNSFSLHAYRIFIRTTRAMTFPTFLGIGAQKCGTSWLHQQLAAHPQIYVPWQRKEVHFFDDYYDRGQEWYSKFFPDDAEADAFVAIGEITPRYIFESSIPSRIHELIPHCQFIVLLRNPTNRLFSQYVMSVAHGDTRLGLRDFVDSNPSAFARGLYAEQLERYLRLFSFERFKILIFEEVFANPDTTRSALASVAQFLHADPSGFDSSQYNRPVSEGHGPPRYLRAFQTAVRFRRWLRDRDMEWVVRAARRLGIKKQLFGQFRSAPTLDPADRVEIDRRYRASIARLEEIIGRRLDCWNDAAERFLPDPLGTHATN
jgi:hypothetical protein